MKTYLIYFLILNLLFLQKKLIITDVINPHAAGLEFDSNIEEGTLERRGGVARLVSDSSEPLSEETHSKNLLVLYYDFEHQSSKSDKIVDSSGFNNNGKISSGGLIVAIEDSTCGNAGYLFYTKIKISFSGPEGVPKEGLTFSAFVKFANSIGERIVFSVSGKHFGVMKVKFINDVLIFSYKKCDFCETYFELMGRVSSKNEWFHLATTYNTSTGVVMAFVDSLPINRTMSKKIGPLKYWGNNAIIGNDGPNSLNGFVDDVKIHNYALSSNEIGFLNLNCCFKDCNNIVEPKMSSTKVQHLYRRGTIEKKQKYSSPLLT